MQGYSEVETGKATVILRLPAAITKAEMWVKRMVIGEWKEWCSSLAGKESVFGESCAFRYFIKLDFLITLLVNITWV
jgi:hypothetical protein